ncbi:peptide-methionine (S)-S-oxide reductase MsrA [Sinomicrobium weinanense]|uniref:Peptide methionine sulfoxide reductase MsrA n=1 Tax=Sinomicrobium weinanense TaxID=2842200 RepID=A0A926JUD2_9FLAO|nr:peptide-methionine (S)-S-oxide reductase MsrA [Sinomicrobium weinanense]MBC9797489.1 peptide-methionine (S)-S-oxide reductase MsrA [Sinomicrobium weinanense]MBU3122225.1 peptide-methionine (S)-S-oxide reductase MsrA [Sinomicrobium weinanense]
MKRKQLFTAGKSLGLVLFLSLILAFAKQGKDRGSRDTFAKIKPSKETMIAKQKDTATFAAGCFWCVESQFLQLEGVKKVVSGYTGGSVPDPTYKQVCTGTTGHAEACNIIYDASVISFDELLEAFFVAHDPTQLNRQGNDRGTQYRSAIFYRNGKQKEKAEYYIKKLNEERVYDQPIVTEVSPLTVFYRAEDYHQDYYNQNKSEPYCQYVIQPKLKKFKKVFKDKLKH